MMVQGTRSEERLASEVLSSATPSAPVPNRGDARSSRSEEAIPSTPESDADAKRAADTGTPEKGAVREAVEAINREIALHGRSIRFEVDDRIDEIVVRIVDRETSKVIRQIPPEEVIELRARIRELAGGLLDTKG